ncbi:pre-mRNA-splicing factor ISY1-like [Apium graveolens]|uniref:pre-mRNA-splicing factor ISY1-like n=1 Tax=Apium graveolens TaxID=4045 RepID=UPI003D7B354D
MDRNKEKVESMLNRFVNMEIEQKPVSKQWRPRASQCEHLVRDLNDEINKLLPEKLRWEHKIIDLGGPNYIKRLSVSSDENIDDVTKKHSDSYRYLGAMKKLNGVREVFETKLAGSRKRRKTGDDMFKRILEEFVLLAMEEKVS